MGGSLAPVRVAGFTWNGWQPSAVYAGREGLVASQTEEEIKFFVIFA
jgi:hypothetical protein